MVARRHTVVKQLGVEDKLVRTMEARLLWLLTRPYTTHRLQQMETGVETYTTIKVMLLVITITIPKQTMAVTTGGQDKVELQDMDYQTMDTLHKKEDSIDLTNNYT